VLFIAGVGSAIAAPEPDRATLEAALQGGGSLMLDGRVLDRAALRALYESRDFAPAWDEGRAAALTRALAAAQNEGLDPGAYAVVGIVPIERELLLTDAFLRYASALARGRVWPGEFEKDWRIPAPAFDPPQAFAAAATGDVVAVLASLTPSDSAYQRLRGALARYRDLAARGWPRLVRAASLHRGDRGPGVAALRGRLAAEGFDPGIAADTALFDNPLAAAVGRFQAARGLAPDGVAGRATIAALDIPPQARVKQIMLNLERSRSLPRFVDSRRIEVNAAAEMATFYDGDNVLKETRVIVGSVRRPTPVLRAEVTAVLFNPPWNVPSSILRNEILPRLKRDPGYLDRLGFSFMDRPGGRRLVQRPGPENALGQLKFEMPNPANVYLHDTPDRNLFARPQRALSHGCIRVDDPRDLARILLDSNDWSRPAIDGAIASGETQSVPLPHRVPVYVLYWTAFVDPDGTVEFRDDLYGRDKRLVVALASQGATEYLTASAEAGGHC